MKSILYYVLFAVTLLVVMFVLFFTKNLPPVPGLGFILGTMGVMVGYVAMNLSKAWGSMSESERAHMNILNDLRWYFVLITMFFFVDTLPHVILPIYYPDVQTITTAHWLAHTILFVSGILAARIAVSFFNPRLKPIVTIVTALIGMTALAISFVRPDSVIYIPTSEFPLIASDRTYAIFNLIFNLTAFFLPGVYLIIRGIGATNRVAKIRASLLGIGFLLPAGIGYFIHFVKSPYLPVILYVMFVGWAIFQGSSALYTAKTRVPVDGSTPPPAV